MNFNINKSFVFILLFVLLFSFSCSSVRNVTKEESSVFKKEDSIKPMIIEAPKKKSKKNPDFNIIKIEESLDFLETSIIYPEFDNYAGLNKQLKNLIESGWHDFKKFAELDWLEATSLNSSDLPPYEYYVTTDVSFSKNLISIYFNIYSYKGGAHGQNNIKTINYDIENDKYLTITDVTKYTYDELSDACRTSLYKSLISDNRFDIEQEQVTILTEMIDEGTLPIASNFDKFILDGSDLIIFFEQGKVAPNYYGELSVELDSQSQI